MKKLSALLLCIALVTSVLNLGIYAEDTVYSGECGANGDNVIWEINVTTGKLTIFGEGETDNYGNAASVPWYSYNNLIVNIEILDGITTIGNSLFAQCNNLTSIKIPSSITSIGAYAFSMCENLDSVYITDIETWCNIEFLGNASYPLMYADKLYVNNELVTSINIPDGITSIPDYAFSCENIESIVIPNSVTNIGGAAFMECTNLSSINIPNNVTTIKYSTFYNCSNLITISLPNGITSIDSKAFYNCVKLESINIPPSILRVGEGAFFNCDNLKKVYITDITAWCNIDFKLSEYVYGSSNPLQCAYQLYINNELAKNITIPYGITNIPDYAFSCENIESVTIPNSVTSIGIGAFSGCINLTNIHIPDNVTSIGNGAFDECTKLINVNLPDKITIIGAGTFCNCKSLKSIHIPNNVTTIEGRAFERCSKLESINFAEGSKLSSIGEYTFSSCSNLTSINLPNSVTTIGRGAFGGCSNLTSIDIPDGITILEDCIFQGCNKLTTVNTPAELTSIENYAFSSCKLTSIKIPSNLTNIGEGAFMGCSGLQIIYCGTPAEWDTVTKGTNWALGIGYNVNYINDSVKTQETASIRISSTNSGLRFKTHIAQSVLDMYIKEYGASNISVGTLIAPSDLLNNDTLHHYIGTEGIDYIDVIAFIDKPFSTSDNINTYAGSIVNITSNNLNREFTAIGYIKLMDNNSNITYIYSDSSTAKTVSNIAKLAYDDVSNEYIEGKYESLITAQEDTHYSKYSPYTKTQRDIIFNLIEA